jgi:predicted acetyltransferase
MNVSLGKATDSDIPMVRNMVSYYVYDMSEYMGWPCQPNGCFIGCEFLETYWSEEGKHAFVLKTDKELVGFAMVRGNHPESNIDFSIAEFFILRKFRKQGIGQTIAIKLFDQFKGKWMVEQLEMNAPAVAFWHRVIDRYSKGKFSIVESRSSWGKTKQIYFESKN